MHRWPQRPGEGLTLMATRRSLLATAALVVFVCACSNGSRVGSPDILTFDRQMQAFQAAVQHVTKDMGFTSADPRPVRVRGPDPRFPDSGSYLDVDSSLVIARSAAIEGAGLEQGRVLPLREGCTGFLVPPPHQETSGCPENHEMHLVFGQLEHEDGRSWKLPVVEVQYAPTGLAWTSYEVVLESRTDAWTVVGETPHQVTE